MVELDKEAMEKAARIIDPKCWAMIDKYRDDDDWNGGTAANARHASLRHAEAVITAYLEAAGVTWWRLLPEDYGPLITGEFMIVAVPWERSPTGFVVGEASFDEEYGDGGAWFWAAQHSTDAESEPIFPRPTHFMPLPASPKSEREP